GRDAIVRNDVAEERLSGQRIVDDTASGRKITVQFRQRRHRPAEWPVHAIEFLVLDAAEEEQAVALNRSAERTGVVLEVQLALDAASIRVPGRDVVRGIESLVP